MDPAQPIDTDCLLRRAAACGIIPLAEARPGLLIQLRYATGDNFTGFPFYPPTLPALLHADTAAKLDCARQLLQSTGHDLLLWDAWRPPEAQVLLWQRVQDERFVARPSPDRRWSWHCYGRAVDVTVVHAESGTPLAMPSPFDDFTPAARSAYTGTDSRIAQNLSLLQNAMTGAGFHLLAEEWWHFSDPVHPIPAPLWLTSENAGGH